MKQARLVAVLSLALMLGHVTASPASTPEKWAELMKRAATACAKASGLKKAKAGTPVDFSDKVLVMVDGLWPQPHMKNAPARFACLYDKRNQTAEANEAAN